MAAVGVRAKGKNHLTVAEDTCIPGSRWRPANGKNRLNVAEDNCIQLASSRYIEFMATQYYREFLTATILRWRCLLRDDQCKHIIIDSLQWLVNVGKCNVYAFVIMPNHIHLIWKISDAHDRQKVQGVFFSFTGHAFKKYLKANNPSALEKHYVGATDRIYQFWEREPLYKECFTDQFLMQKLEYIHKNPCTKHWDLATNPEEYKWSSASFYFSGDDRFSWLTHIDE